MNNKKYLNEVNELLKKVLEKCYFISTHSKCDVFFEYSPHINCFTINYYEDGHNEKTYPIYLKDAFVEYCTIRNLSKALMNLDKLYEEVMNGDVKIERK